jgi:hypothetical protein
MREAMQGGIYFPQRLVMFSKLYLLNQDFTSRACKVEEIEVAESLILLCQSRGPS